MTSLLNGSHVIKGRWKIVKKIGQGAFGEIYQAKNVITSESVAIKVERVDSKKQVLKLEVAVLKKLQDCAYVCRFLNCGRFADVNYMVMELLGENISELRRRQTDGRFSLATTLKLGIQMLRSIEAIHDLGYLHRDIKPSNFAIGLSSTKKRTVFIIDFGLARKYVLPTGEVRPARDSTGFRGTARYASINSHLSRDLGRRDDLWSLLYVMIEFVKGSLPWRKIKDKDQIGEMKIQYNNAELVSDLPGEFLSFMEHLQTLRYMDKPDYNYLTGLLQDLCTRSSYDDNYPFDWEVSNQSNPAISTSQIIANPQSNSSDKEEHSRDDSNGRKESSLAGGNKRAQLSESHESMPDENPSRATDTKGKADIKSKPSPIAVEDGTKQDVNHLESGDRRSKVSVSNQEQRKKEKEGGLCKCIIV